MKFLFAVPPFYTTQGSTPYGISIVATVAKRAGLDVDMCLIEKSGESVYEFELKLLRRIRDEKFDVVSFGGMSPQYSYIKRMIKLCSNEGCITILGGNIVDPTPELIAENIGADYCIVGEAEETFTELAFALQDGKQDMSDINGLIYRNHGGGGSKNKSTEGNTRFGYPTLC